MGQSLHQPHSRWARLRVDVNCGLRRGAWYPVVRFVKSRAILDVTDDRVPVARDRLQITFTQPLPWSLVQTRAILAVTADRAPVARARLQITFTQPLHWSIVQSRAILDVTDDRVTVARD